MGVRWGLTGLLAATSVSRLLTSFWFEPYLLHKRIFETSSLPYFLRQGLHLAIVAVSYLVISGISRVLSWGVLPDFLMRGVLCLVVPNGLMLLANRKTQAFSYLRRMVLSKLKKA